MFQQQIAIPAYFHSDLEDWGKVASACALLEIVVFNPASG
jgi:hypothetical protein